MRAATTTHPDTVTPVQYRGKRMLDLVVGIPLAILAAPAVLVIASISAVVFRAWPFFTQEREGLAGHPLRLVKVRSLPTTVPTDLDRDELDVYPTSRWGNFIRHRHLDELPQIFQVVGGSMSLVGPRPMIASICERMDDEFRELRHQVLPGVTGLWQISEDGTRLVIEAKHHDERYINWSSLRMDLRILVETAAQVFGKGRLDEDGIRGRFPVLFETDTGESVDPAAEQVA